MVAGDVVNTAARLQAAAPVNGVLVGEATYRATRDAIEYRERPPVDGEGQGGAGAGLGGRRAARAVGVDVDARRATRSSAASASSSCSSRCSRACARSARPQLVTLVGVPGSASRGWSRALRRASTRRAELIAWRQGRCLPYGEGVTFWALGEIVKARGGRARDDDAGGGRGEARATPSARSSRTTSEARWMERELRAAGRAGAGDADGDAGARRFAAWRRFLEALGERGPAVLVFEDLHWADDGLLDFVDDLVDWLRGVPLLLVATARPELLERRPGWGGGKPNATTISLQPLAEDDDGAADRGAARAAGPARRRAAGAARARGRQPAVRGAVRAHALRAAATRRGAARVGAGRDRGAARRAAAGGEGAAPGGGRPRQGLLARRHRRGAAACRPRRGRSSCCGRSSARTSSRRERRSAVARRHASTRSSTCCCATSPTGRSRGGRAREKHRHAARWIEALGRPEDHAELLAHHYARGTRAHARRGAIRRSGRCTGAARCVARGRASARSRCRHTRSAGHFFADALALTEHDGPALGPRLLLERARALFPLGRRRRSTPGRGARRLPAQGNAEGAAQAATSPRAIAWFAGDRAATDRSIDDGARGGRRPAASRVRAEALPPERLPDARRPTTRSRSASARRHYRSSRHSGSRSSARACTSSSARRGAASATPAESRRSKRARGRATPRDASTWSCNAYNEPHVRIPLLRTLDSAKRTWSDSVELAETVRPRPPAPRALRADGAAGPTPRTLGRGAGHRRRADRGARCRATRLHRRDRPLARAWIRLERGDTPAPNVTARAPPRSRAPPTRRPRRRPTPFRAVVALALGRREEADERANELVALGPVLLPALCEPFPNLAEVAWLFRDLGRERDFDGGARRDADPEPVDRRRARDRRRRARPRGRDPGAARTHRFAPPTPAGAPPTRWPRGLSGPARRAPGPRCGRRRRRGDVARYVSSAR